MVLLDAGAAGGGMDMFCEARREAALEDCWRGRSWRGEAGS